MYHFLLKNFSFSFSQALFIIDFLLSLNEINQLRPNYKKLYFNKLKYVLQFQQYYFLQNKLIYFC